MSLTKSVLCGMMLWISCSGCATVNQGYVTRFSAGVDYHVNSAQPDTTTISLKCTIDSK